MAENLIKSKLDSAKFKESHNEHEWTSRLDEVLKNSVLTNYFNFNLVSLEINDEAQKLGLRFGTANAYTNEKCRIRWFYIHCTRALEAKKNEKLDRKQEREARIEDKENLKSDMRTKREGKAINPALLTEKEFKEDQNIDKTPPLKSSLKFKTTAIIEPSKPKKVIINEIPVPLESIETRNGQEERKETKKEPATIDSTSDPRALWESKEIRVDKKEINSYADAEKYQWKQNLTQQRNNRDYLDVSKEDFSNYKTIDVQGNEVTPSTFNIFRDSFKKTFTEMRDALKDNLPDLKPDDTTESDDNEEVVPLDFRTKFLEGTNDVVLQAKPLRIYRSDEDDDTSINDLLKKKAEDPERSFLKMSSDAYLNQLRKDEFKDDDENVILIQPHTNIKDTLSSFDLECNKSAYLNNSINAPKAKTKPPKVKKTFKQDEAMENLKKLNQFSKRKKNVTINETPVEHHLYNEEEEYPLPSPDNDLLNFDNILNSQGIDVDDILNEGEGNFEEKKEPVVFNQNTIMQLLTMSGLSGLVSQQKQNNYLVDEKQEEQDEYQNDTSENEAAPMSALVDDIQEDKDTEETKMNEAEKKQMAFRKSLVEASSASEDERGFNHQRNTALSSDEEIIDTSSKRKYQSVLSGQAIKAPSSYSGNKMSSSGANGMTSSGTGDLIIQLPGLSSVENPNKAKPTESVSKNMTPDSLLFKSGPEVQNMPTDPYRQRPQSARTDNVKKILYRGVWIEAAKDSDDEKDTTEEDRFYFNKQRELMKQRLRANKNQDFGDVDKLKMENVGVELIGQDRLVKVDRDWGSSMQQFDTSTKKYAEDDEAQPI